MKITDHIYCCRSGSAAHTQAVADIVAFHTEFMAAQMEAPAEVRRGFFLITWRSAPAHHQRTTPPTSPRRRFMPQVKQVAHTFRNICYTNRDGLSAGIICAGWDKAAGGQVFSIPLGGMCLRRPFAIGGSGSTYIYGHCDATFRPNMTREECVEFVKNGSPSLAGCESHKPSPAP